MPNSDGRDLRLICFPPESRFEIGVHAAVHAAVESEHGSILESVQVKLRETYPDVIVIVHEPFGTQGEDAQTTWIFYRDGQEGRLDQQHEQRPVALVVDDEPLVRDGLLAISCECYGIVQREFKRLLGIGRA
jgi:hypothetical protein